MKKTDQSLIKGSDNYIREKDTRVTSTEKNVLGYDILRLTLLL